MAYLTIKQIKDQYNIADKTIRRLYINKTISRSQGYKNKKGKWVLNSDFIESRFADKRKDQTTEQVKTEPKTSQTNPDPSGNQALLKTIEVLQAQLEVKDRQIDNLTQLTDQQQKLTAQLQTQLLIASSTEPITAQEQQEAHKAQPSPKKAVRQAKKSPQSKKKATKPKKKIWWRRG
jgi:hypothetical protein